MTSIFLRGGTILCQEGELSADVIVKDGRVQKILKRPYEPGLITQMGMKFSEENDISGKIVLPGLIDCHVHFREPGLEHKETMETGAAAALAGGVTTVCEMPNTDPPTVTISALADKVKRAEKLGIDMRFFFGATEQAHLDELKKLFTDPSHARLKERCCGLKLYLDHSTGNQCADKAVMEEGVKLCGELDMPIVCHCEDAEINRMESEKFLPARRAGKIKNDAAIHSEMRPPESEEKAIQDTITLAKKHGARLHVVHLSTKGGLNLVRKAKADGDAVTCEVAPHHLFLTIEDYATLGALAKMNPPLRTREHQEALWEGIMGGAIDCIATDHAPHTLAEKQIKDPLKAPSGVPGVETMFPLLLSVAGGHWPHPGENGAWKITPWKFSISDVVRLCFSNPNRIFNLGKQGIKEGAPADMVIVDTKKEWTIKGNELHSKCGWSPYDGWHVFGHVVDVVWQKNQS